MNEGDIREQIRQKLMEGRLPGRFQCLHGPEVGSVRAVTRARSGSGERCSACGECIDAFEPECTLQYAGWLIRFHDHCETLWHQERWR
jgi:hypothetical protein